MNDEEMVFGRLMYDAHTKCFEAWDGGQRLGTTLRRHCIAYFTPTQTTVAMVGDGPRIFGGPDPRKLPREARELMLRMYEVLYRGVAEKFRENDDAYAENIRATFPSKWEEAVAEMPPMPEMDDVDDPVGLDLEHIPLPPTPLADKCISEWDANSREWNAFGSWGLGKSAKK